jgi:glutamine cyclotransferase
MAQAPKEYTYKVVKSYPHDVNAYTQGLFYYNGFLYESTGLNGQSSLRKVDIKTGTIMQISKVARKFFTEGICLLNNKIYQLTWENQQCFIYDANSFKQTGYFSYNTEGWGLTTNGNELIMSDGSSTIYFRDPSSFAEIRRITVRNGKNEMNYINELEYINGEIWANVYTKDFIIRINPDNGNVTGIIHLKNLLPMNLRTARTDVLNGIAYDAQNKRIFVTGKNWPKLYEIVLVEKK